ncbi:MAG TPA: ATP-binding protein [Vicinamibacterales bacterium]
MEPAAIVGHRLQRVDAHAQRTCFVVRSTEAVAAAHTVAGGVDRVTMTVTDEGPGIPAEHRDRIFDRFSRIDEGRSREIGGTGLGLAIAKWAVKAHGGDISVEQAGAGSAFRLIIPRTAT